jgi:hypothetical protein
MDRDLDGVSNRDEYLAGSDPLDRETYLNIYSFTVTGSPPTVSLDFVAFARQTYSLLRGSSVHNGSWVPIADAPATPTNRLVTVRDSAPLAPGETQRFYRLVTPRQPPSP